MSFFRSIRSSITRGKSSSRDTTPVRGSRPPSVIGSDAAGRRDSMDSRADSLFNRSDTFILGSSDVDDECRRSRSNSNASTLEKKSKKSKVLSKFSTFTKRKKTPPAPEDGVGAAAGCEHHPSDDATNTYYKWKAEGGGTSTLDYDAQTDPFNFLYEQQASRRSLQNASISSGETPLRVEAGGTAGGNYSVSKYRKSRLPTPSALASSTSSPLKEQLEQLKATTTSAAAALDEEEPEAEYGGEGEREGDKYKTITLNSFRKSFREKLLKQQTEAPHNPSWFVEVEPPAIDPAHSQQERLSRSSKENRPDFLVFENDNYRPQSRSPVRDRDRPSGRSSRSNTRSPVKRNETFRVERPAAHTTLGGHTASASPSIRIEIKNSIAPNLPGRIVPVGVAKPMPSPYISDYYQQQRSTNQHQHQQHQPQHHSQQHHSQLPHSQPLRSNWSKASPAVSPVNRSGRYQTLVQIRSESAAKPAQAVLPPSVGRHATRIQLGGGSPTAPPKRPLNGAASRYSIATASLAVPAHGGDHSSYDLFRNSATCCGNATAPTQASLAKTQRAQPMPHHYAKPRHTTYFGDAQLHPAAATATTTTAPPSRTFSATGGYAGSRTTASGKLHHHHQHHNYQPRAVPLPVQRRSRSPIKMPWR